MAILGKEFISNESSIYDTVGNFTYVNEVTDLELVGGERIVPLDEAIEFVVNPITGMLPLFVEPIRLLPMSTNVVQAPLTLLAIVYVGPGDFIRSASLGAYVQSNVIIATPFGKTYDIVGDLNGGSSTFFVENFVAAGKGVGTLSNLSIVSIKATNVVDKQEPLKLQNCRVISCTGGVDTNAASEISSHIEISGKICSKIIITGNDLTLLLDESYLNIRPDISKNAVIIVKNNVFSDVTGGKFFKAGNTGIITSCVDNSLTGSITALSDNGAGGTTVTSSGHGLLGGRQVTLSLTTSYNNTFKTSSVTANTFDINTPFVADDATGTWNFNSVKVTSNAHGILDETSVQISKSANYDFGSKVFGTTDNTFNIEDVVFVGDDEGIWDTGSISQNDPRMFCFGNGDQADSAQILSVSSSGAVGSPVQVIQDSSIPTVLNSFILENDDQFTLNPPGAPLGTIRYDGKGIRAKVGLFSSIIASSGNPTESVQYTIEVSTQGGPYIGKGVPSNTTVSNRLTSAFSDNVVSIVKGDLLRTILTNLEGTSSIDIVSNSLIITAAAQGV